MRGVCVRVCMYVHAHHVRRLHGNCTVECSHQSSVRGLEAPYDDHVCVCVGVCLRV